VGKKTRQTDLKQKEVGKRKDSEGGERERERERERNPNAQK
jgi:hypothetical protein